jgi:multiple RNA-binding domain-containing protein 1
MRAGVSGVVNEGSQFAPEKPKEEVKTEKSSFKMMKREQFLKNLDDDTSWNSLFLNPNTVMEYVAQEYGITKNDLLNREVENPAVKIAVAETKILNETKEWLQENGVNMKVFDGPRKGITRSRTTIVVKNIPKDATKSKLVEIFNRYGVVVRLLLPPNKALALVQFRNIDHAGNAFKQLSGFMLHGTPLYLEYAPDSLLKEEDEDDVDELEKVKENKLAQEKLLEKTKEVEDDNKNRLVFVKNLNFKSTEDDLAGFLKSNGYPNFKFAKVIMKNGKSCGYGFVEFSTSDDAEKALRNLNMKILDNHKLELSISRTKQAQTTEKRKEKEELVASNKIVIRNIDFAASKKELRDFIASYGEVRAIRMPSKVTGEHRGYVFVEFSNVDEAKQAYTLLSSSHFYGRKLVIEYAKE